MRSEYQANKALFETAYSLVKKTNQAKLADMQSMKEWQVKNKVFGRAVYILD